MKEHEREWFNHHLEILESNMQDVFGAGTDDGCTTAGAVAMLANIVRDLVNRVAALEKLAEAPRDVK